MLHQKINTLGIRATVKVTIVASSLIIFSFFFIMSEKRNYIDELDKSKVPSRYYHYYDEINKEYYEDYYDEVPEKEVVDEPLATPGYHFQPGGGGWTGPPKVTESWVDKYVMFDASFQTVDGFYMSWYSGRSIYIPNMFSIHVWATDMLTNAFAQHNRNSFHRRYIMIAPTGVPMETGTLLSGIVQLYPILPFVAYADRRATWIHDYKFPFLKKNRNNRARIVWYDEFRNKHVETLKSDDHFDWQGYLKLWGHSIKPRLKKYI